ncbi:MAG: glycosyltransferase [Desulfobacteraceae bacterium]|nr:glycosyltransferase [Desulfobacteraceae bacterium]
MDNTVKEGINNPKVSVLMPNLNNRPFLEERIQTILDQTFTDWELIVVDNYSDDGAWELIKGFAEKEPRMRISQAPREGMYANWNNCIRLARGEYIYIATSDDTMFPDCLEKTVAALDVHPECGICHTCLKAIDENGNEIPGWWRRTIQAKFYGELLDKPHIRFAPYDGILYCALRTVYLSITQLLIRRSVFDEVGLFRTDWGVLGDNEWEMRAALVCNTIHIPETLATWRMHPEQGTKHINYRESVSFYKTFTEMIQSAFKAVSPNLQEHYPECYKKMSLYRLLFIYTRQYLALNLKKCNRLQEKISFLLRFTFFNLRFVKEYIFRRIIRRQLSPDDFTYIGEELRRLGLENNVKVLE